MRMRPTCSFGSSAPGSFHWLLFSCNPGVLSPAIILYLSLLLSLSSTPLPLTLRTGCSITSPLPCPSLQEDDVPYPVEWLCHVLWPTTCDTGNAGYIGQKISESDHGSSALSPHTDDWQGSRKKLLWKPGSGVQATGSLYAKCTHQFEENIHILWIFLM